MYLEKLKLDGRVAVVTGGGRAIGLACCQALGGSGRQGGDRRFRWKGRRKRPRRTEAAGFDADIVMMDVTKPDEVEKAATEVVRRHGTVDVLVCNAGIARSGTAAEEVTDEHWLNVMDVNVNGVFWCCRSFGKHMIAQKRGAIVNLGSMSGYIVNRPQKQSYYNASKAAVHHLTVARHRMGALWRARQRGRTDLHRHADGVDGRRRRGEDEGVDPRHADGPPRQTRRDRVGGHSSPPMPPACSPARSSSPMAASPRGD